MTVRHMLALLAVGRFRYNVVLPNQQSSQMSVALSADATDFKHASAVDKQFTAISIRPLQFGKFGDSDSVTQLLRDCQSCCLMGTLRWLHGNDHAPNLKKFFVPYISELYQLKENKLVVDHMMLLMPPEELNESFEVVKSHPIGTWRKPESTDARWGCFSDVEIEIDFMVAGDLSMQMQLMNRHWRNESLSSPRHDVLHGDTGKIFMLHLLPSNMSLADECLARWPNCAAMHDVTRMGNDSTLDIHDLLLRPEEIYVDGDEPEAQCVSEELAHEFSANSASRTKARKRKVNRAFIRKTVWKDAALREALPDFENFKSQADTAFMPDDAMHYKTDRPRLVVLPFVPSFVTSALDDGLADFPYLHLVLGICNLHADMRVCELMASECEEPIRAALKANATAQATVDEHFNKVMKDSLKIRHAIRRTDTGDIRGPAFNGGAARILRNDWNGTLSLAQLASFRRTGGYSSSYFEAIFQTVVRLDCGSAILSRLPEMADCAQHLASAIATSRLMKPQPKDYDKFDHEASLFVAKWRILGNPLKGYGFHLWATMGKLFREYKYLEPMNQSAVEANNERMGRQMPHLTKGPRGRYSLEDLRAGPDRVAEVLATRRRRLKSLCRGMYEFTSQETVTELPRLPCLCLPLLMTHYSLLFEQWDATFSLGSKGRLQASTAYSLTSSFEEIDARINAGDVRKWKEVYVPLWKRWDLKSHYLVRVRSHSSKLWRRSRVYQARPPSDREMMQELLAEVKAYYDEAKDQRRSKWHTKRKATFYRYLVTGMSPTQEAPPPGTPAAGFNMFPITPPEQKELAGLLFVEVYQHNGALQLFLLEQLTMVRFRRQGVMSALYNALVRLASVVTAITDDTAVHLLVRRKAKQQEEARNFYVRFGFEESPKENRLPEIKPNVLVESYLTSTVAQLRRTSANTLLNSAVSVVCRNSFRSSGLGFERTAARAIKQQHMCALGDNSELASLVPTRKAMDPLVLFGFL